MKPDGLTQPRRNARVFFGALALAMTLGLPGASRADDAPNPAALAAGAQALLKSRCYECHGARTQKSGLRLDGREAALKGGESGDPAIIPGKGADSPLVKAVKGEIKDSPQMPPKGDRLTEAEIALLREWIDAGAEWPAAMAGAAAKPGEESPAGAATLDPATPDPAAAPAHWSYQAPKWPKIPAVSDHAWVRNPIDAFIMARLDKEGLKPAPEADRRALIRRASLDLTGLPPSPDEVEAFVSDKSPGAYERVVDRLLASPAYGERWAAPWLDMARYADSNGFEKDSGRVIWPYRDWVIRAFNDDKPFDQFVIEQLAGDMLPAATRDQIIATGFNRNSMINEEGGVDPEEAQSKAITDRVDTTATVFLAATMACAQCHSHKYDPISQTEYYRFFAIFNRQESDFRIISPTENRNGGPTEIVPTRDQERLLNEAEAERRVLRTELVMNPAKRGATLERLWELQVVRPRKIITTMVMRESAEPPETFVHKGGDFRNHGDKVEPGLPDVWPPAPEGEPVNRLTLARWLVAPENPLTARVFVNRAWDQFFGIGIVKTTEDFGSQGERPVHPELLDWLALTFQWRGWSVKSLHRLIATSATYMQDSAITPEKLERDPYNRLVSRGPRYRLPAEMIRDQALRVSGLLSPKMFGPSVFPHQPEGVWKMPYSSAKWKLSEGEDRFRRGVYTWWQRTAAYPAFMTFDAPTREAPCTRRSRTNTPTQALVTLNDPVYMEAAQALARRTMGVADADARLDTIFRLCLSRPPAPPEAKRLRAYLDSQLKGFRADPTAAKLVATEGTLDPPPADADPRELAAWTMVANVMLNLDETLTKN